MRTARNDAAWIDLESQLDWEAVRAAHRSISQLAEHDYNDLAVMTVAAAKRWAVADLGKILAVEQRFLVSVPSSEDGISQTWPNATKDQELALSKSGARVFKGFADVVLKNNEVFVGGAMLADWKTASDLSPKWVERQQWSWQGRLYCWAMGAKKFTYRGIERSGRTREVSIDWPILAPSGRVAWGPSDAENRVQQAFAVRESQMRTGGRWLLNTDSCRKYGRDCNHLNYCHENEVPTGQPNGPLSYSAIETLLTCPDRYRLDNLLAANDTEDDLRTALGRAFHKGQQCLYEQMMRVK